MISKSANNRSCVEGHLEASGARKGGGSNTYPENDQVDGGLGNDVAGALVDRVQALQRVRRRRDVAYQCQCQR